MGLMNWEERRCNRPELTEVRGVVGKKVEHIDWKKRGHRGPGKARAGETLVELCPHDILYFSIITLISA